MAAAGLENDAEGALQRRVRPDASGCEAMLGQAEQVVENRARGSVHRDRASDTVEEDGGPADAFQPVQRSALERPPDRECGRSRGPEVRHRPLQGGVVGTVERLVARRALDRKEQGGISLLRHPQARPPSKSHAVEELGLQRLPVEFRRRAQHALGDQQAPIREGRTAFKTVVAIDPVPPGEAVQCLRDARRTDAAEP